MSQLGDGISPTAEAPAPVPAGELYGVVAEFESPDALLDAVRAARDAGYSRLDAFTPFPIHGIDQAMGARRSMLGYIVFAGGLAGCAAAVGLQWFTGAVDYPLVIGGKPFFAVEFSMPIIFELTVLLAAFATVGGMLFLNGLPRFYHPVFQHRSFPGASDDRFLLAIEADGPDFQSGPALAFLRAVGGSNAEVVSK